MTEFQGQKLETSSERERERETVVSGPTVVWMSRTCLLTDCRHALSGYKLRCSSALTDTYIDYLQLEKDLRISQKIT
jgi:hypothetical protein